MDNRPEFRERFEQIRDLPSGRLLAALIDYLAGEDPVAHEVALDVLTRVGRVAVPRLIEEALKPGRSDGQILRMLNVIDLIDLPLSRDEQSVLLACQGEFEGEVKAKIKRLLRNRDVVTDPQRAERIRAHFEAMRPRRRGAGRKAAPAPAEAKPQP